MSFVLTRKEQESIIIFTGGSERVVITIEAIIGNQIKMSFDMPDDMEVWRDELLDCEDEL